MALIVPRHCQVGVLAFPRWAARSCVSGGASGALRAAAEVRKIMLQDALGAKGYWA